jgi:Ni/Co efflux regulator RcnB
VPADAKSNLTQGEKGETMKKIFSALTLVGILAASMTVFAQDQSSTMKKDDTKQSAMKSNTSKTAPAKTTSTSSKKTTAKKSTTKKDDTMKKDDSMKKPQ